LGSPLERKMKKKAPKSSLMLSIRRPQEKKNRRKRGKGKKILPPGKGGEKTSKLREKIETKFP